ncbi:MAG: hypothetical protein ABII00_02720 [Elusimicrobiota bacterium]
MAGEIGVSGTAGTPAPPEARGADAEGSAAALIFPAWDFCRRDRRRLALRPSRPRGAGFAPTSEPAPAAGCGTSPCPQAAAARSSDRHAASIE